MSILGVIAKPGLWIDLLVRWSSHFVHDQRKEILAAVTVLIDNLATSNALRDINFYILVCHINPTRGWTS
jgi:hypothetical protein